MKALLDMQVSPGLASVLAKRGHEGVHASQMGLGTSPDEDLLGYARAHGMIVVTADLDFPRLMALSESKGPGVLLFRGGNYSEREMADLLSRVLDEVGEEVLERSICVVDRRRIRITSLPLRPQ